MNRRTLLGLIASLPFCGWLKPKHDVTAEIVTKWMQLAREYDIGNCMKPLPTRLLRGGCWRGKTLENASDFIRSMNQ